MITNLPAPAAAAQPTGERDTWRKSSRSGSGDNCVEVKTTSANVQVRDSKDPVGGHLTMTRPAWHSFVQGVRDGDFDL